MHYKYLAVFFLLAACTHKNESKDVDDIPFSVIQQNQNFARMLVGPHGTVPVYPVSIRYVQVPGGIGVEFTVPQTGAAPTKRSEQAYEENYIKMQSERYWDFILKEKTIISEFKLNIKYRANSLPDSTITVSSHANSAIPLRGLP